VFELSAWKSLLPGSTCIEKREKARYIKTLPFDINQNAASFALQKKQHSNDENTFFGYETLWFYTKSNDSTAPTTYVAALLDCERETDTLPITNGRIRVHLEFLNDMNHSQAGEDNIFLITSILNGILLLFGVIVLRKFFTDIKKVSVGQGYNSVYLVVNVCLVIKIAAIPFETFNVYQLMYNGERYSFVNYLSQALNFSSEYVLSLVMIFIAHGWTITF
jgi:Rhodopsin-like GPCR transmembrane domain